MTAEWFLASWKCTFEIWLFWLKKKKRKVKRMIETYSYPEGEYIISLYNDLYITKEIFFFNAFCSSSNSFLSV